MAKYGAARPERELTEVEELRRLGLVALEALVQLSKRANEIEAAGAVVGAGTVTACADAGYVAARRAEAELQAWLPTTVEPARGDAA